MTHTVTLLPGKKQISLEEDETLLTGSLRSAIPHLHACGGVAACSTCRVAVETGLTNCSPRSEAEQVMADMLSLPPEVRLACQVRVSGPVTFRRLLLSDDDVSLAQAQVGKSGPVGTRRQVAVLFADIRNFTPMCEAIGPYDLMYILNRFFDFAGAIIKKFDGEINNYIGDAFLAVFMNNRTSDSEVRAVSAAVELQKRVDEFSENFAGILPHPIGIRIGIHSGDTIVGMLGAPGTERLSVIGETINIAARAEAANKDADTRILITEPVYQVVKPVVTIGESLRMRLKGVNALANLYEVKDIETIETENGVSDRLIHEDQVYFRALDASDLKAEEKVCTSVRDREILFFRHGDQVRAVENRCPHMNLPLNMAQIASNGDVLCPFHQSKFCSEKGDVLQWCDKFPDGTPEQQIQISRAISSRPLPTFPALEQEGAIWVKI
jgi:class 3 adenylate cyclase/nitrite reductase/ring-hydroxylating ferredoxin subunit